MAEIDDAELAVLARAGKRDAFDALVVRHGPALLSFLRRVTGRTEDALDLFQETFLKAFRALPNLEEPARFKQWVARIALNSARRHFERRMRLREVGASEADDAVAPLGPDAHGELLDAPLDKARLRAAIDQLPPRQKTVLSLRVDLDLSFAEIAEQLDIREENARANHYQALKSLKRALTAAEPTHPIGGAS